MNKTDLLKILVLDDEYPVRCLLRECIDWESLNLTVCGEAANSREAYQKVISLAPDIIFVDINLPTENGIEFSRRVLSEFPSIRIIIITGYEEFAYAQECLRIGVSDFITKPIVTDEIIRSVTKVRDQIHAERMHNADYEKTRLLLEKETLASRERFAYQLLNGLASPEIFYKQDDFTREWAIDGVFQVALFQSSNPFSQEFLMSLARAVSSEPSLLYAMVDKYHFAIISNKPDAGIEAICHKLTALGEDNGQKLTVGIGCSHSGMHGAFYSCEEALQALRHLNDSTGTSGFISRYIDLADNSIPNEADNSASLRHIYQLICSGHAGEACVQMRKLLIKRQSVLTLNSYRESAVEVMSVILEIVRKHNIKANEQLYPEEHPFEEIFKLNTRSDIISYLEKVINWATEMLAGKSEADIIRSILLYISENFGDCELSLVKLADTFHINSSYLSRLFKQRTGTNFSKYLTDLRVQEAMKLLCETNLKINEISELVGILDPHYLGKCFKSKYGMSMRKYRDRYGRS